MSNSGDITLPRWFLRVIGSAGAVALPWMLWTSVTLLGIQKDIAGIEEVKRSVESLRAESISYRDEFRKDIAALTSRVSKIEGRMRPAVAERQRWKFWEKDQKPEVKKK